MECRLTEQLTAGTSRHQGAHRVGSKITRMLCGLTGLVFGMIGMAYASVPLYQWFCQVTGFGGTTQRAEAPPPVETDHIMEVRFTADVNGGMPWQFQPVERQVEVKLGEQALTFYRATTTGDEPIVGTATFNVTPDAAGAYFMKIACFCFTEQVLMPGESVDMPVQYIVDPEILNDHQARDIQSITLSYTFFRAPDDEERTQTSELPVQKQ